MHLTRCLVLGLVLSISLLGGCEKKITRENAGKVTEGMTLNAVTKLLGSGEKEEAATGTSISSAGLMDSKANASPDEVYVWKDGSSKIIVTFRDGKVTTVATENLR